VETAEGVAFKDTGTGVITQSSTQLSIDIDILDDWVRLVYSSLAYGTGSPATSAFITRSLMTWQEFWPRARAAGSRFRLR